MRIVLLSLFSLVAVVSSGCRIEPVGPAVDDPYESCYPGDRCTQGTACLDTTLPASAGYTGSLCTVTCNVDLDCPQDLTNYASICVNSQCYTQCPTGSRSCPYGTGCITFDSNTGPISICTP